MPITDYHDYSKSVFYISSKSLWLRHEACMTLEPHLLTSTQERGGFMPSHVRHAKVPATKRIDLTYRPDVQREARSKANAPAIRFSKDEVARAAELTLDDF